MKNDHQRVKVYKWEHRHVHSLFTTKIASLSVMQSVVNYVWEGEGLKYPPEVYPLQNRDKRLGCANRMQIGLQKEVTTSIIIHEIAHAMTQDILDDAHAAHNAYYVGVYMKLLVKYLNMNLDILTKTADECGVKYNLSATPLMKYV